MAQYKIRDSFYVFIDENNDFGPGEVVDLTEEQAKLHLHKLEPVEAPKRQRKAATEDAAE